MPQDKDEASCLGLIGVVGLICGALIFMTWAWNKFLIGLDPLSDEEIRAGRPCTATVLSVTEISANRNGETVYDVKLRVKPTDGAAYEATVRDRLNSVEGGRVGAGATEFRCVIDADDASRVEVFWLD